MKCKHKSEYEGLLFTGDYNLLIEFLGNSTFSISKGRPSIETTFGEKNIYKGDYIIRDRNGDGLDILTEDEFREEFDIIETIE